mgnify:CR=1 FL=1
MAGSRPVPGEPVTYYGTCPPDWSAGVLHVGHEQCLPGHAWQGVRDHYLLHYVCDGRGEVRAGSRRLSLGPGDAFLFAPGDYLHYRADDEDPWYYIWVGFRGLHAHELVAPLGTSGRAPALRLSYSHEVRGTLERMLSVLRERDVGNGLEITGLLYELFALLARAREASSAPARPVRTTAVDLVEEARRFVQQNYQREIDVGDVIRHIGIDRSHFSRVFRESEGVSLRSYLISTRMDRAMRLLAETDLAVRAVASSVGYRTYESFERRFRDYFGRSPSQARSRSESGSPRSRRRPSDSRSMP